MGRGEGGCCKPGSADRLEADLGHQLSHCVGRFSKRLKFSRVQFQF